MGELIEVTARIGEYLPDAMRDEYDDGSFAVFDATVLDITAPAAFTGSLKVYHNRKPAADSPWRRRGSRVGFTVDRSLLEQGYTVFSSAAKGLRLMDGEG